MCLRRGVGTDTVESRYQSACRPVHGSPTGTLSAAAPPSAPATFRQPFDGTFSTGFRSPSTAPITAPYRHPAGGGKRGVGDWLPRVPVRRVSERFRNPAAATRGKHPKGLPMREGIGGRFPLRLAHGLGMIPCASRQGFHPAFHRSAEEGTGPSANPAQGPCAATLLTDLGALETVPVDHRRMAVGLDRPLVIPSIAHMVMLGMFQLQAGNLLGRFRGIRFDHRFTENRTGIDPTKCCAFACGDTRRC
jgi:hypothetical protein